MKQVSAVSVLCFGIHGTNKQPHRERRVCFSPCYHWHFVHSLVLSGPSAHDQSSRCLCLSGEHNSCVVHKPWETFSSPLTFPWGALIFEHHLWTFINSVRWLWINVFPLWLQFRAFEDIWLGLTGTAASSSVQSQILVEGIMDQKEKVKVAASKGKECFQCYMGYLKGMYLPRQLWQSYDLVFAGPVRSRELDLVILWVLSNLRYVGQIPWVTAVTGMKRWAERVCVSGAKLAQFRGSSSHGLSNNEKLKLKACYTKVSLGDIWMITSQRRIIIDSDQT